jgi:hypothetical protein
MSSKEGHIANTGGKSPTKLQIEMLILPGTAVKEGSG